MKYSSAGCSCAMILTLLPACLLGEPIDADGSNVESMASDMAVSEASPENLLVNGSFEAPAISG